MVTTGLMGHSAMTRINETCTGNEITTLYEEKLERRITRYTLAHPHFGRTECGSEPVCSTQPTLIETPARIGVGGWQLYDLIFGTPTAPRGMKFMKRKDICQAVSSSPGGFH